MADSNPQEIMQIKLIAVGESGVGKTSILNRFIADKFNDKTQPTLGAAFLSRRFKLSSGKEIEFHIWDTAGQQKYRSIARIYYRQAKVALCVYDITSRKSYSEMKSWMEELKANAPANIVLCVVGNKIDLCDEQEVEYANVKEYATKVGAILKLVSAKEGKNIEDLFKAVAEMAVLKMQDRSSSSGRSSLGKKKEEKRTTCC